MSELKVHLIHQEEGDERRKLTEVNLKQGTEETSQSAKCNHCESEVTINIRSSSTVRNRYVLIMLPSILLGAYFIISRALTEGVDTIILSVTLYVLFGFLGYLILVTNLMGGFLAMVRVKGSPNHRVELN